MRKVVQTLGVASALVVSGTCLAAASNTQQLSQQMQKISVQAQQLQQEVASLKAQIKQMKRQRRVVVHTYKHTNPKRNTHALPATVTQHNKPHLAQNWNWHHGMFNQGVYGHGITVTTSPLLGLYSAYDASNLLINTPTMNEDLRLLRNRAIVSNTLLSEGIIPPYDYRPVIVLGGRVEGQILGGSSFNGAESDINLSGAELDVYALAGPWASGLLSIEYDSSPPSTGNRSINSRLFLRRGFLTIGNLNRFPLYFSLGQMYAPFGRYASNMVTTPLTESVGRILARTAVLGFAKDGFSVQGYAFNGPTNILGDSSSVINQGGVNAIYDYVSNNWNAHLGAGIVSNLAASEGMQDNGIPETYVGSTTQLQYFSGFGAIGSNSTETLIRRVPALDMHAMIGNRLYDLIAEYIMSTRSFALQDLSFNGSSASPSAIQLEGDYKFHMFKKPFTAALSWGQTWQSAALNLPYQSIAAILSTSLWRSTVESIEFRHDNGYSTAVITNSGRGQGTSNFLPLPAPTSNTQNLVTGQIDVYF